MISGLERKKVTFDIILNIIALNTKYRDIKNKFLPLCDK